MICRKQIDTKRVVLVSEIKRRIWYEKQKGIGDCDGSHELQNLASQGSSKGANEMLPFLMSAAAQGKKGGLKFNADEISAIIEVLKMGKSPAEAQKLDKVVNLMKMMR